MATGKYALLGWPVEHSVSPPMQEAGFDAIGQDASYELIAVAPGELAAKVAELKALGFDGWNVTIPHKTAIIPLLDEVETAAAAAGSVNTVVHCEGKLWGYSTDGYGLAQSMRESFDVAIKGGRFLFWGTGGAARATSVYVARQGAAAIILANRTLAKAMRLRETIWTTAPNCQVEVLSPTDTHALQRALASIDVLIQSTSVGLHADDPISVPQELLHPALNVLDMIYRPTPLLAAAEELGCRTADGRGMLLHQGVKSFAIWTGAAELPVEAMRQALHTALDQRDG